MKRLQTYDAPGITVTFEPNVCRHSAVCLRTLPAVFDVGRRRWVAPRCWSAWGRLKSSSGAGCTKIKRKRTGRTR